MKPICYKYQSWVRHLNYQLTSCHIFDCFSVLRRSKICAKFWGPIVHKVKIMTVQLYSIMFIIICHHFHHHQHLHHYHIFTWFLVSPPWPRWEHPLWESLQGRLPSGLSRWKSFLLWSLLWWSWWMWSWCCRWWFFWCYLNEVWWSFEVTCKLVPKWELCWECQARSEHDQDFRASVPSWNCFNPIINILQHTFTTLQQQNISLLWTVLSNPRG